MSIMISLTLFVISAVLLAVKRNNAAGVCCGIVGTLFGLVFFWCWFSVQSKGRAAWYELALLLFGHPMIVTLLAVGLGLTIANAVVCYRKEEGYYPD